MNFAERMVAYPISLVFWVLMVVVGLILLVAAIGLGFVVFGFLGQATAQTLETTIIQGEVVSGSVHVEGFDGIARKGDSLVCETIKFVMFQIKGRREPIRLYIHEMAGSDKERLDTEALEGHVFLKLSNVDYRQFLKDDPAKYYRLIELKQVKEQGSPVKKSAVIQSIGSG